MTGRGRPRDPHDALYRHVAHPYALEAPVVGIPAQFTTNEREVLAIVADTFGAQRTVPAATLETPEAITLRITVHGGTEGPADHAPITARVPEHGQLLLHTPGSIAVADLARRGAVAYVTPQLVADRQHFRYGIIEALTLFLVTHLDRHPVHAAAVGRGGAVLLLAGRSGVGKSSLAYAALRAGLEVLSDDAVYVQREPALRVWGMPRFLHLPPDAREYFPDIGAVLPTTRATGDLKLAVDLVAGEHGVRRPAERVGICLLERGPGPTRLRAVPAPEIARSLLQEVESGFDLFAETLEPCVTALARLGCWRLDIADPPQTLVPFIERMLDALDAGGPR